MICIQAKDAAGDAAGSAKSAAGDAAGSAKSAAGDAKGSGKDVLGDLKGKGKDLAGSVNEATPNLSANPFDDALGKVSAWSQCIISWSHLNTIICFCYHPGCFGCLVGHSPKNLISPQYLKVKSKSNASVCIQRSLMECVPLIIKDHIRTCQTVVENIGLPLYWLFESDPVVICLVLSQDGFGRICPTVNKLCSSLKYLENPEEVRKSKVAWSQYRKLSQDKPSTNKCCAGVSWKAVYVDIG